MNYTYPSSSAASSLGGLGAGFVACYFVFVLLLMVLMIVVFWKLFAKAGYSGWLSLLMLVPLVNFGMLLFLAFAEWPVLRELQSFKSGSGYGVTGYPPPVYQPPAQPQGYGAPPPPARGPAGPGYAPPVPNAQPPGYGPVAPAPAADPPRRLR